MILDSYYTCVAVFPNLRKEWLPSVHLIVGTIGMVLEIDDKPHQIGDKYLGAVSVKLLLSRLPSNILLPNLLDSMQASFSQKILYRGLPNQCFCCFGFGHLVEYCLKLTDDTDKHISSTTIVPYQNKFDGWTMVGNNRQRFGYRTATERLKRFGLARFRFGFF